MVKRSKATRDRLAFRIHNNQALCFGNTTDTCHRCITFPRGSMHHFSLMHRRGETQFVVVATSQRELQAFVPRQLRQCWADASGLRFFAECVAVLKPCGVDLRAHL